MSSCLKDLARQSFETLDSSFFLSDLLKVGHLFRFIEASR